MKIAISLPEKAVAERGEQITLRSEMYDTEPVLVTVLESKDGMIVLDVPEDIAEQHKMVLNVGGSFSLAEMVRPREIQCATCDKVKLGFFDPWECIECQ